MKRAARANGVSRGVGVRRGWSSGFVALALGLVATAIGVGASLWAWDSSKAAATTVAVGNNWFGNSGAVNTVYTVNINVGDTVQWTWQTGANAHTVTETNSAFVENGGTVIGNSGITTAGYGPRTFNTAGSYYYYCFLHPVEMRGRVNVAAPPSTAVVIPVGNNWFGNSGAANTVYTVDINAGDTVQWSWQTGANAHTVTETNSAFVENGGTVVGNSGITTAGYGPITFNTGGTFFYYCFLHPVEMRGRINVSGGSGGGGGEVPPGLVVGSKTSMIRVGFPEGARLFSPNSITISSGDTVTWALAYGNHDVTSGFTSSSDRTSYQSPGGKGGMPTSASSFSRVFTALGTYTFYCDEHASDSDARLDRIDQSIGEGKMVGKIVVLAADATGPTASGVVVSPNPASGVVSVSISATITDGGSPNSTIINAEAFVGAVGSPGSGNYLPVADGAWDETSEAVSGTVSIAGLAAGDHSVSVRGRDQRGNWGPTFSVILTIAPPDSGPGSVTTRPVDFGTVTISGADQGLSATPAPWRATDASGLGWSVTITASDFTGPGASIAVGNLKVRLVQAAIQTVSGNTPPVSQATSFQPLDDLVAVTLMRAVPGTGVGTYDVSPEFHLTIPGDAAAGSYTSTLAVSFNIGP